MENNRLEKIKIIIWLILFVFSFYYRLESKKHLPEKRESGKVAGVNIINVQGANAGIDLGFPPKPEKIGKVNDPPVYAKSIILMDGATSYPMYEKNAHTSLPIASTTKIMTAILILENTEDNEMDGEVTVSREAALQPGHIIGLRWDEKIRLKDLLNGLLLASGNDAAYALAQTVGEKIPGEDDSVKKFVDRMNEKAVYLGLDNTKFRDPAGLDDSGHSSAFDLAMMASYALRQPKFSEIVRQKEMDIYSIDGKVRHHLKNSNRLVGEWDYPGAIGVKTGFTPEAGHTLVAAAERNGHRLISVILNTNEYTITASASESRKLLDWGFNNWKWE